VAPPTPRSPAKSKLTAVDVLLPLFETQRPPLSPRIVRPLHNLKRRGPGVDHKARGHGRTASPESLPISDAGALHGVRATS
jgi:hypothetical protein